MPLTFPSTPTTNQEATVNGRVYRWTGSAWEFAGKTQPALRSDVVGNTIYIGKAVAGTAENAQAWTIRRATLTNAGAVSATATASNVRWTDRLTATYS